MECFIQGETCWHQKEDENVDSKEWHYENFSKTILGWKWVDGIEFWNLKKKNYIIGEDEISWHRMLSVEQETHVLWNVVRLVLIRTWSESESMYFDEEWTEINTIFTSRRFAYGSN